MPRKYPTGIRPYKDGWRARIRVGASVPSALFPKQTPMSVMVAWREDQRATHFDHPPTAQKRSGFEKDAQDYLAAVKGMPSFRDRERDILWWVAQFGDKPRRSITAGEARAKLAALAETKTARGAKFSASALNHRLKALIHLWVVIDGKRAPNPIREIPRFTEPDPKPRDLSAWVIWALLSHMPRSKTKARLAVMAATGIPPAQLMRVKPEDVKLDAAMVYLEGRKKGKGTKGGWRPLTGKGVQAFRTFVALDAFGAYSDGSLYQMFRKARESVAPCGSLNHIRPYDFRHSFATVVLARTGDMKATQQLLGHSNAKTTERYVRSAIDYRVSQAIKTLDAEE